MAPTGPSIGVLVPADGTPPPPESRPIGRAALMLQEQGVRLVFGDRLGDGRMDGLVARPGGWTAVQDLPVEAVHDRFPSQIRADSFQEILAGLGETLMANPLGFTELCRDKTACQRAMERAGVPMPELSTDPATFEATLAAWGAGFIKPRYGALGCGVMRVVPGDPLPAELAGLVPGRLEPAILQRAVRPPSGWAGQALRVLVQRTPSGWYLCPPVLRASRTDPVCNAARGAEVGPGAESMSAHTQRQVEQLCQQVILGVQQLPEGERAVEVGIDLVLDQEHRPHLIELNSRPRGRLEALARLDPAGFGQAHLEAVARPIRMLAHWVRG